LSGARKLEKKMTNKKQPTKGNNSFADNDSLELGTTKSKMFDNKSKID